MLMEQSDPTLVDYERRLRRHFRMTGFPETWIPPKILAKPGHVDSQALLHMFYGRHLGNSGKPEAAAEFREVYEKAQAADLKARGLEGLTDALMKIASDESARTGAPIQSASAEAIRDLCRRGIEEFQHQEWAPNVIGTFHLVHGTIDAWMGDTFTAKLHLKRALKELDHVTTQLDRSGRKEARAWVYFFLGEVAAQESDWEEARRQYEMSQRLSKEIMLAAATSRLARIYLEHLKSPARALQVLRRTKILNHLVEKDPLRDEIRWLTAKSYYMSGNKRVGLRLYREIAQDADSEALRNDARIWLESIKEDQERKRDI